ncbi:MAG TPA: hypothetical protein VMF69_01870, partial [Gemmataceae bacterium]|nr:hypothetical protein [Gemmataceae bacterium]
TGILMQGPKASKVDGRMVYVGMIYNPQPRDAAEEALSKPCDGARYLAGLYTLEELGLQLRRQGAQVGMNQAQQWIALTDGGNGVEEFMDVNFAQAAKILDFQHAAGHVALRKNVHRRDYAAYLRQGWQIASGGVESACKTVVNQRLCQGEMRLGEEGSDAVAHQRALYRSDADQWEAFWAMAP